VPTNPLSRMKNTLVLAIAVLLLTPAFARAQDKNADTKSKPEATSETVRLTIVVSGGKEKKPVGNASVYVRYVKERILLKDKKIEMDLKTNMSGVCHTPEIPAGKFLIQVVAPGWKTFGEYYEVDQAEKTIRINLAPPPKWY
jgi:hypothetical protein